MSTVKITEASKAVFLAYVQDSCNWSGQPLVGGNVGGSKEERGNLTQLKKAGLIETFVDGDRRDLSWINFTQAGRDYAATLGWNWHGAGFERTANAVEAVAPAKAVEAPVAPAAPVVKAKRVTVTAQLDALFDKVGVDALSVNMAMDLAEAHGLNRTSASIRFYRWKALRNAK